MRRGIAVALSLVVALTWATPVVQVAHAQPSTSIGGGTALKFTSLGRWPTLTEMRTHAYMAIVEGAFGLWWWSLGDNALKAVCTGWCADRTARMNDLKAVVNEIAALEPALLADDSPGALTGNSNTNIKTKLKVVNDRSNAVSTSANVTVAN